jgi:transposase-like protein
MHYSYIFKRNAVDLYHQGLWPDTPDGISTEIFRNTIRGWVRIEESCGPYALCHKEHNKEWSPEERYALVARVLAGESLKSVAYSVGVTYSQLNQWVRNYKNYGYNGLIPKQRGRKSKNPDMKKIGTRKPPKPNESEYEELIRLRAENAYMKAEIEVIKKEIALREEKEAARLKAKKQQSSKNSGPKDSN